VNTIEKRTVLSGSNMKSGEEAKQIEIEIEKGSQHVKSILILLN
jgi:hypothetical protein